MVVSGEGGGDGLGGAGSGVGCSSSESPAWSFWLVCCGSWPRMAAEWALMSVDAILWMHSVRIARAVRASSQIVWRAALVVGRTIGLSSS